jgi:hypothetical protein
MESGRPEGNSAGSLRMEAHLQLYEFAGERRPANYLRNVDGHSKIVSSFIPQAQHRSGLTHHLRDVWRLSADNFAQRSVLLTH